MKTLTQLLELKKGQYAVRDGTLWLPRQYSGQDTPNEPKEYVPAINLYAFAEQYEKMYPSECKQVREHIKQFSQRNLEAHRVSPDISTIVFDILPHFVKVLPGFERRKPTKEELLDYICSKTKIPAKYFDGQKNNVYRGLIAVLQSEMAPVRFSAKNIDGAFTQAVVRSMHAREIERLKHEKAAQDEAAKRASQHNALLKYLSDTTAFEINGFGFQQVSDFGRVIYKRIPEYALKHFDGRIYLFPECRVGAALDGGRPIVIESYKHPFLSGYRSRQSICVGNANITGRSNSALTINAIEAGITALLHGYYNERNFNGYHGLGGCRYHGEYVVFDDYLVTRSHPKIKSGKVQITNDALIKK